MELTIWPPIVAENLSKNQKNLSTKYGAEWTSIAACRNNFYILKKDPRHPVTALV
jgi:hypothetical protein